MEAPPVVIVTDLLVQSPDVLVPEVVQVTVPSALLDLKVKTTLAAPPVGIPETVHD